MNIDMLILQYIPTRRMFERQRTQNAEITVARKLYVYEYSHFFIWQTFRACLSSRWEDIDHSQLSFSSRPDQLTILYFRTHNFETFFIPVIFCHIGLKIYIPVENVLYFYVVKFRTVMWSWFKVVDEEKLCNCFGPPDKSYAPCQWRCLY